jgi:hypothetical protein
LSSWKFKAKEGLSHKINDDPFNTTMIQGIAQAQCVIDCYEKNKSMKKCSIANCRSQFDSRHDGRNGKYSFYSHVVKSLYAYQFLMWFEYFPKSSFFVFSVEEYKKNPIAVTEAILNFLGLPLYDPDGRMGFTDKKSLLDILSVIANETPYSAVLEKQITKRTIDMLKSFFSQQNETLKKVLESY